MMGGEKNNNPILTQMDQDCRGRILFPVNEQESSSELMFSAWGECKAAACWEKDKDREWALYSTSYKLQTLQAQSSRWHTDLWDSGGKQVRVSPGEPRSSKGSAESITTALFSLYVILGQKQPSGFLLH